MAIQLDHLIVPSHNRLAGAKFLADLLGVPSAESPGHFAPVFVNETLTLDFADHDTFESHHYCFHVSDAEFEAILGRLRAAGIAYRSQPRAQNDFTVNPRLGGKNLYWEDADGHLWEILTVSYARADSPLPAAAAAAAAVASTR